MRITLPTTICLSFVASAFGLFSSCAGPGKGPQLVANSDAGPTGGSAGAGGAGGKSTNNGGSAGSTSADARADAGGGRDVASADSPPDVGGSVDLYVPDVYTPPPTFSQCRFHFGTINKAAKEQTGLAEQIDLYGGPWIGYSEDFGMKDVCDDMKAGTPLGGKVPALVAYIIAFTARRDENLQDCNMSGGNNLCTAGATYMRAHLEDRIIPQYEKYAKGFAAACGTTHPMIWLMEPDFYQYSGASQTQAYTAAEAGQIMARLVATVKKYLPNAVFSMDISPWIPNNGANWYSKFTMSDFTFINTSGGNRDASKTIVADQMTWAGVHGVTGKPIIADTGYGAGGGSQGHDQSWDLPVNINARIKDGVVAIIQYNPKQDWAQTISSIRSQIDPIPCP